MKYFLLLAMLLAPSLSSAQETAISTETTKLQELENRIYALESAPAKASQSSFNPAMGAALDFSASQSSGRALFNFRAAELNVESAIDPYLKGWAVFTGSPSGTDVEEAGVETTSLPYNLTVRGGRLFATFGRLGHVHDHELPVTDRPVSMDRFIGGESQGDGVEASWLFPTDTYINAVFGAYNKIGADNTRIDITKMHKPTDLTYLGRLSTYKDINDNNSIEAGASCAWTPGMDIADANGNILTTSDTGRRLAGIDITYRYQPDNGGLDKGLLWGTELFLNSERRVMADNTTSRVDAYAGYSYLQLKMGPVWRGGVMADMAQNLDDKTLLTQTYSAFISHDVSEFQRLRAVYSVAHTNDGTNDNHTVTLQWTAVMGHHVHGFRDR